MCQLAGDEVPGDRREVILVGAIVEGVGVFAGVGQRLVGVHARAGGAEDRLGHEGCMQATALRHELDRIFQRHQLVGMAKCVPKGEVQLVLARADLVMAGFDDDAAVVERRDDLLADLAPNIERMIEVPGAVVADRMRTPVRTVGLEQEKFQLGGDAVVIAQGDGLGERPGQHTAGIAGESLALGGQDVADHLGSGHRFGSGLRDGQRLQVRTQEHVALEDPGEPLHRGAVEPLAMLDGMFQARGGDGDALHRSQHVDELQVDETDGVLGQLLERPFQWGARGPGSGRLSLRRQGFLDAPMWRSRPAVPRTDRERDDRRVARACRVRPVYPSLLLPFR